MPDKSINNSDKSCSVDVSMVCKSHDQDGCHDHIMVNPSKIFFSGTAGLFSTKLGI